MQNWCKRMEQVFIQFCVKVCIMFAVYANVQEHAQGQLVFANIFDCFSLYTLKDLWDCKVSR